MRVSELGGYRLIATLGKGETAKVYLALKRGPAGFTKLVVVKALRRDLVHSLEHIEMFLDEARLSARLNHPNLVQTFEVGEEDGRYFIEMEYLAGQTLRSVYRRVARGAFPVALQLRILSDVARGLHYAHTLRGFDGEPLGIVHRDVNPHNVMLTYDGHVKLLDFGVAQAAGKEHLTDTNMLKGMADYAAPEQVRGDDAGSRADVFALGAMAYEAVTGRSFSGGSKVPTVTRLHRRISGAEPPVREVNPNVPESLADLIDSATALDPQDRVATAAELADRIDAFLERTQAHVGPSVLAKLLERPFEADRRRLGQLVEAQTQHARSTREPVSRQTSVLPAVQPGDTPTGLSMRLPPSMRADAPAASRSPTSRKASQVAQPAHPTLSRGLEAGVQPLPSEAPPPANAPAGRTQGNLTQIFSTVLAGAALLAAAALWWQRGLSPHSSPAAEDAPKAAQTPAKAAAASQPGPSERPSSPPEAERPSLPTSAPEMVRIRIQVVPSQARVLLDGAELNTPADLALEKSEREHVLQASAPGFEPLRRTLSQSRDADLVLRLKRKPKRRSRPTPRPPGVEDRPRPTASGSNGADRPREKAESSEADMSGTPTDPGTSLAPGQLPSAPSSAATGGAQIDLENPYR